MRTITATELKENLKKYLELGLTEDILVTKNGKPMVKISSANSSSWDNFVSKYKGICKNDEKDLDDPRIAGMLGKLWEY